MNQDIDTLTDSRDGNRYRIVKIRDRWWMAENVRYGVEIPVTRIQTNNGIVERYRDSGSHSADTAGGIYHWLEAMNYQVKDAKGVCPDQWHIPTYTEWKALFAPYPHLYALQYYGKDGFSRLNLELKSGATRWKDGSFWWSNYGGHDALFWCSSYEVMNQEYHPYCVHFNNPQGIAVSYWEPDILEGTGDVVYYPVRCVKNK
jgi:uncharacterized protein (TIGR02145 family)